MVVERRIMTGLMVAALAITGCQSQGGRESSQAVERTATVSPGGSLTGTVVETMDAGGYTYARVEDQGRSVWAAGPEQHLEAGTRVTVALDMPMQGFRSETLDRTFDVVYFVRGFGADSGPAHAKPETAAPAEVLAPADHTVAAIHAGREQLAGKTVRVRGRVVKSNSGILGTNWIHIQDGTGTAGTNDLTVTTDAEVEVGAIVLVVGELSVDRDFGAGYRYAVIVEGAKVTVE